MTENVYLKLMTGDDANDGSSRDKAVQTWGRAMVFCDNDSTLWAYEYDEWVKTVPHLQTEEYA